MSDNPVRSSTRRPRILHVVHRFLPEMGGTEMHVAEVASRLAERGEFDVTVLATDRRGDLERTAVIDGYDVVRRRAWPRDRDYYASPGLGAVIARGDWDLVHVQGVHTLAPPTAMLAALASRTPYVLTFHSGGSTSPTRAATRSTQWRMLAPLLRRAAQLIAVSRFEVSHFADTIGVERSKFRVIRNGGALPPSPAGVLPRPGRIVASGRLEEYKGHQHLIEAMPYVRKQVPEADLVVLGAGRYEPQLRTLVRELGLDESVSIRQLPPAGRDAMAHELGTASVMASMSSYEAHPVAIMEALTLGLPVAGLDVAGTGDLVEDGLVSAIPSGATSEQVADVLVRELRATAERGGPHVPQDLQLPTWESTVDGLVDVYRSVLDRA